MLTSLSRPQIALEFKKLVQEEQKMTAQLLEYISVIMLKQIYLDYGFPSLFAWMTTELGYSPASAQRRIDAARILQVVPDAKEKVENGEINLTSLAQLQVAVRHEEKRTGKPIPNERKIELVQKMESKSAAEAEKVLFQQLPSGARVQERVKQVSQDEIKLNIGLSLEQFEKLKRLKEVASHSMPQANWAELITEAVEFYLKHKDPLKKKVRVRKEGKVSGPVTDQKPAEVAEGLQEPVELQSKIRTPAEIAVKDKSTPEIKNNPTLNEKNSRHPDSAAEVKPFAKGEKLRPPLSARIKKIVLQRDQGRCTWVDLQSGRVCGSGFQVQVDHVWPKGMGGSDDVSNLRCLCRKHNIKEAERFYGSETMERYRTRAMGGP